MIVTMSPMPYDFLHGTEANQTTSVPLHPSPCSNPLDSVPWASTGYEYPSPSSISAIDSDSAWPSFPPTSRNYPNMFPQNNGCGGFDGSRYTAPALQQPGHGYASSVQPSPVGSAPEASMWDSIDYNNQSVSPYSDPASMSASHASFSQGNTPNPTGYFSSAHLPVDSRFSSPSFYQTEATEVTPASTLSRPQREDIARKGHQLWGDHSLPTQSALRHKARQEGAVDDHPLRGKPDSAKRKRGMAPSSLAPKPTPAVSKPGTGKFKPVPPPASPDMMNHSRAQIPHDPLLQRFGASISRRTTADTKAGLTRGDHIRREAMRLCEAEVKEMAERRRQLTENSRDQMRETAQLVTNVQLLKEATAQNQQQLEEAMARVKGLRKGE